MSTPTYQPTNQVWLEEVSRFQCEVVKLQDLMQEEKIMTIHTDSEKSQ